MSLKPAHCATCDLPLRIPDGASHVSCARCGTSFLLPGVALQERRWESMVSGGGMFALGAVTLGLGMVLGGFMMPEVRVVTTPSVQQPVIPTVPVVVTPVTAPVPPPVPVVPAPVLVRPSPTPTPVLQVPSVINPEPDYLRDSAAMKGIMPRIHEATAWTGRLFHLTITDDRSVVALVEVEGGGFDSVLFSWGHVVVKPMALTEEDRAQNEARLFTVTPDLLGRIPTKCEAAIQAAPTETTVDRVSFQSWEEPTIRITRLHPRLVLEEVEHAITAL